MARVSAQDEMVIALGVTMSGKSGSGVYPGGHREGRGGEGFFARAHRSGLHLEQGLLCIIDGAKGIRSAIQKVFGERALVQRCQWHKRENVVDYLPKHLQATCEGNSRRPMRSRLTRRRKAAFERLKLELKLINISALRSLEEGFGETLTLHRLGLFPDLE